MDGAFERRYTIPSLRVGIFFCLRDGMEYRLYRWGSFAPPYERASGGEGVGTACVKRWEFERLWCVENIYCKRGV